MMMMTELDTNAPTYCLGVDVGGTKIAVALLLIQPKAGDPSPLSLQVEILHQQETPTPKTSGAFIGAMSDLCQAMLKQGGLDITKPLPVGLSVAGCAQSTTGEMIGSTGNIPAMDEHPYPIVKRLSERLGWHHHEAMFHLENDANAAAFGEVVAGAAKGKENVTMVTLGTGVGGGLVVNGRLLRGANFSGAEVGHMRISLSNDRLCPCGRLGCWEAYASGTGLASSLRRQLRERLHSAEAQALKGTKTLDELTTRDLMAAVEANNPLALQVLDEWHLHIATGLGNLLNILDSDVAVIGGGMARFVQLHRLASFLNERLISTPMLNTPVVLAELGNQAGFVGAGALAYQRFVRQQPV